MPDPSVQGLGRVARLLGADAVGEVRRLGGNVGCAVHRVELLGEKCPQVVVVKRFPASTWALGLERLALGFAHQALLPSPEVLGYDPHGTWFGTPALIMSCLPGRPVLTPEDLGWWAGELAGALTAIHATATQELPGPLRGWPGESERWPLPSQYDDARTRAIASSVSVLRDRTWEQGFCHYDFHPGNVLFDDSGLAGVVDWGSARDAPYMYDVGWCRCALTIWPGTEAPELFRAHYARLSARSLDGLAYWDVLAGAIILKNKRNWLAMYHSLGVNISGDLFGRRATAFIDDALAWLNA